MEYKKRIILQTIFLFTFIFIAHATAQSPYRNLPPPVLQSPSTSSGGNVTSVTSGDNCIIINPTTGDVIITFNNSCSGSGGAVDSVSSGDDYLVFNPTTGDVVGTLNEAQLNITIDSRIGLNPFGFINSSIANNTYYLITNPSNFINITTGQFFNDTALINSVNSSLWSYINTNEASWLSTFNSTYNNILDQECPVGNYTYAIQSNGTILCRSDNSGSSADFTNVAFLNNTQTFTVNQTISANLTVTQTIFANLFSGSLSWTNLIDVPNIIYGLWTTQNNNNLLISNGTAIGYNQTILNQSIVNVGLLAGFNSTVPNSTTLNCANITGNSLCQTQSPTFGGGNFNGQINSDNPTGVGTWHTYSILGGIIPIGRITSENLFFQLLPVNGFDLVMGNNSLSYVFARANGYLELNSLNGAKIGSIVGVPFAEFNSTMSSIYTNTSLTGTRHNWAVPNGYINATGVNITSNHQTFETGISISSQQTNNNERGFYWSVSIVTVTETTNDQAYVDLLVNGTLCASAGIVDAGAQEAGIPIESRHHLGCFVPPGATYELEPHMDGDGSVDLLTEQGVYI